MILILYFRRHCNSYQIRSPKIADIEPQSRVQWPSFEWLWAKIRRKNNFTRPGLCGTKSTRGLTGRASWSRSAWLCSKLCWSWNSDGNGAYVLAQTQNSFLLNLPHFLLHSNCFCLRPKSRSSYSRPTIYSLTVLDSQQIGPTHPPSSRTYSLSCFHPSMLSSQNLWSLARTLTTTVSLFVFWFVSPIFSTVNCRSNRVRLLLHFQRELLCRLSLLEIC